MTECLLSHATIDALILDGSLLHSTDFDWMTLLNKAREDLDVDERISLIGCSFKPFKLPPDATISRVDLSHCKINDAVVPNITLQNVILRSAQMVQVREGGGSGCSKWVV